MELDALTRTGQSDNSAPVADTLQARTLQMFTLLHAAGHVFRRKLALCLGEDEFAPATALALLGLGGACLTLDVDGKRLQASGRSGSVDFVVSSLSEALRILKNEIRKGTAVSVGLAGEPDASIQAMLHRGVQPDLVCVGAAGEAMLEPFTCRGAVPVALPPVLPDFASHWRLCCGEAPSLTERRADDARMLNDAAGHLQCGSELDRIHRLWLKTAPRLFTRDRSRMYWGAE